MNLINENIRFKTRVVSVEFAGVKFKAKVSSGDAYVEFIEKGVIKHILNLAPGTKHIIICEEKYSFTPDDFKAATRLKRMKAADKNISHLKTAAEMINSNRFDKTALTTTSAGKSAVSMYLAQNASKFQVNKDIIIDIDSESCIEGHTCSAEPDGSDCSCKVFAKPLRCLFKNVN